MGTYALEASKSEQVHRCFLMFPEERRTNGISRVLEEVEQILWEERAYLARLAAVLAHPQMVEVNQERGLPVAHLAEWI